jgi:predicted Zn-dependent protease
LNDPENTDALERLGRLYGRHGDLARAHLHTGLFFKAEGQREKARYHLEKAKAAAGNAPMSVKSRIEDELRALKKGKKES